MTNENSFTFELVVKGDVTLNEETQEVTSKLSVFRLDSRDGEPFDAQLSERRVTLGAPAELFSDEQQFLIWFKTAFQTFIFHLPRTLRDEASLSFRDQANATLHNLKVERIDMNDVVDDHVRDTADRVKDTLGLSQMGQPSQWTKLRLSQAIRREVARMPKEKRTLENVVRRLQSTYPDQAPASSESLRKLIARFELDWKKLRRGK